MTKKGTHKIIIGRSELLYFVDALDVGVPAKVDTGAYRSALQADAIKELPDGSLEFSILKGHPVGEDLATTIKVRDYKKVWVVNSFGQREERYEVRLKAKLSTKVFKTGFTLANRAKNTYPVLIGRTLLNGRFMVDSSQSTINRLKLKKKYGIVLPKDERG